MIQFACHEIKKYYGSDLILKDVTFEAAEGERIALVGLNGCGKTTLLNVVAGVLVPEEGVFSVRKGAVTGYLEQQPDYPASMTVRAVIELGFGKLSEWKKELEKIEFLMGTAENEELERLLKQYSTLSELYQQRGGYDCEEKFSKICGGLKIREEFLNQNFRQLSGGEKTLTCLAKVLLAEPDLLILDEPTNHLDMDMLCWLETYLQAYRGTVLMVSHDRYFLDSAAARIIELHDGILEEFVQNTQNDNQKLGMYTFYQKEKHHRLELKQNAYGEQQKQIRAMEEAIKRMRVWAAQANNEKMYKRAASMQKRIDRIDRVDRPQTANRKNKVAFQETERGGKNVLEAEGLSKAYGGKTLLSDCDFSVYWKEHVAVTGKNGCGKTTLLRMILQIEEADSGRLRIGSSLKIAYLPQQINFPDENQTVLEYYRDEVLLQEGMARELLAKHLFCGESVFKKVKNLSGGEKSRLYLARLMLQEINFLILDEPTNHLDIDSREKLEEALLLFNGTILFVSHDRYFINRLATRVLEIEDGKVKEGTITV